MVWPLAIRAAYGPFSGLSWAFPWSLCWAGGVARLGLSVACRGPFVAFLVVSWLLVVGWWLVVAWRLFSGGPGWPPVAFSVGLVGPACLARLGLFWPFRGPFLGLSCGSSVLVAGVLGGSPALVVVVVLAGSPTLVLLWSLLVSLLGLGWSCLGSWSKMIEREIGRGGERRREKTRGGEEEGETTLSSRRWYGLCQRGC